MTAPVSSVKSAGHLRGCYRPAQIVHRVREVNWVLVVLLPCLLFLLLFMILPLLLSLYQSLQPNQLVRGEGVAPGLVNYEYLMRRSVYVEVFVRTLRLSLFVTFFACLIGYPTALALRRYHARLGSTVILGLSYPILAGPLVVVIGWMVLFPRGGPINSFLLGIGVIRNPITFIGTETAVIISLTQFTLAFVVLNILNSLMRIDPALTEAAESLGANPLRAFFHVTWPLSLPGVLSGSILAFSLVVSAFVAPRYLGGETLLVVTTLIAQFMLTTFNLELASAAAVILVIVSLAMLFVYNRLVGSVITRIFGVHR